MSRQAEVRAHLDLQVNLLAEQESTTALRLLKRLCDHLGLEGDCQDGTDALTSRTDVKEIISELEDKLPGESPPES